MHFIDRELYGESCCIFEISIEFVFKKILNFRWQTIAVGHLSTDKRFQFVHKKILSERIVGSLEEEKSAAKALTLQYLKGVPDC